MAYRHYEIEEMNRRIFACRNCCFEYSGWKVYCDSCNEWNTVVATERLKEDQGDVIAQEGVGYSGADSSISMLSDIQVTEPPRIRTLNPVLNAVLGGGIVPGSVTLIAGNPGSGKSTLMLQALCDVSSSSGALLVSAEETQEQIATRAHRLGLQSAPLEVAIEQDVSKILALVESRNPRAVVIDSLPSIIGPAIAGKRGSGKQLKHCLNEIVRCAKRTGTAFLVICQSTKANDYAGPREVEHMGDALLMMNVSEKTGSIELKGQKNRYGSTAEVGCLKFDPENGRVVPCE